MCYPKAEVSGKGRSGCRLFADNQDKKKGSHPVVGWVFLLYLCADSVILRAPFWKGGFVPPCLQRGAFCRRTSFPRMKSESIGTRITHEGWVVRFFLVRGVVQIGTTERIRERNDPVMNNKSSPNPCPGCGRRLEGDHCPNCLAAIHREDEEGLPCGGLMEPVGIWVKAGGEWEVIRRCRRCGQLESGPVAARDNPIKLLSIASKPLSQPPFPIERLEELTRCMGGSGNLGGFGDESRE